MNVLPKAVQKVIESFQRLPGVGPKTAQRLALYLLHVPQTELDRFADSIKSLKANTILCSICKNIADTDPCSVCSASGRDKQSICVAAQAADVLSLEKTGQYHGVYHVLHGVIDPLNSIGPDEIYIADLIKRIVNSSPPITEIILAINATMEGEATTMYIQKQISQLQGLSQTPDLMPKVSRLAHGLPVGADIEYADEITLSRALQGRRLL